MKIVGEILKWDSDFFGYKVGKVTVSDFKSTDYEDLFEELKSNDFHLAYIYPTDHQSTQNLSAVGVKLVDTKVLFYKKDFLTAKKAHPYPLELYKDPNDYQALMNLALISGQYSRFKIDENFTNNEFERLYAEWLNNSISKKIADEVLVCKIDNAVQGFVTYKIKDDQLIIGLIATSPEFQGKGIGRSLMESVEQIAQKNQVQEIIVATQEENSKAMSFYYSCGYLIKEKTEILHLWIK